jgi:hypothetical protein
MTCQRDNTRWFMTRLKSRGVSVTIPPNVFKAFLPSSVRFSLRDSNVYF